MSTIQKSNNLLTTPAPSGNLLYGTKTDKEIQKEQKEYKEKMLNEEAKVNG